MTVVNKKLSEISMYEHNPRKNDEAVKYVAESIKQFGFRVPIVIDKNGVIIAGHTRYKACMKLGLEEVPCIVADDLTPEQIKAYRLADNKVSEKAEWDFDLLESELEDILNFDMGDFGFDIKIEEPSGDDTPDPGDNGFTYKEQYGVIVMCADEDEQREIYERLTEEGYECKVVAT
ncbi:MAG: ParB N-terminal domain-containing protein [Bullifex sp.]